MGSLTTICAFWTRGYSSFDEAPIRVQQRGTYLATRSSSRANSSPPPKRWPGSLFSAFSRVDEKPSGSHGATRSSLGGRPMTILCNKSFIFSALNGRHPVNNSNITVASEYRSLCGPSDTPSYLFWRHIVGRADRRRISRCYARRAKKRRCQNRIAWPYLHQ